MQDENTSASINWSVFGTLQGRLPIHYQGSRRSAANALKRSQNSPSRLVLAEVGRGTWTLRDWDSHDLARFLEAGEELSRLPDSGVDGQ